MNKERLIKFVYILLRERLTFGDLEAILDEVEAEGETGTSSLVQAYVEEIVNRLLKSGLKCYDNMCNTEDDDVRLVNRFPGTPIYGEGNIENDVVPMCADCRKRNPEAVIVQN